jgi:hypothetical protein
MNKFYVKTVDCSYMFRLPKSNHCSIKIMHWLIIFFYYVSNIRYTILVYKSQQDATLHSLFYLTTALHVSGVTITHFQKNKTAVTTASGNRYTAGVKFTDKEYR